MPIVSPTEGGAFPALSWGEFGWRPFAGLRNKKLEFYRSAGIFGALGRLVNQPRTHVVSDLFAAGARGRAPKGGASFAVSPYKLSWLDIRHGRHSMRSTALRNPVLSGIVGRKIRGRAQ
jgi:hypothetical protein